MAPLTGRARVTFTVGALVGFAEGVEQRLEVFGRLAGQFAGDRGGPVRAAVQRHLPAPVRGFDVAEGAVLIDRAVEVVGEAGQGVRVVLARAVEQLGLEQRAGGVGHEVADRSAVATTVIACRVEIAPSANAAAVCGCAASTSSPVSVRRGVTAAANRTRPAASRAPILKTCRNNTAVLFAPRS